MNPPEKLSSEDQNLINRIKKKATEQAIYPAPTEEDIRRTEAEIGFRLPTLIREIYLQIGNGGFSEVVSINVTGSILTLTSGVNMLRQTKHLLEDMTGEMKAIAHLSENNMEEYLDLKEASENWHCKDTYIIYCDHSCNMYTVVDCGKSDLPVYSLEDFVITPLDTNLRDWWRGWLSGSVYGIDAG